ncbi:MAG TPA: BrnT family toxin [Pseudoduganella sp.]
MDITYDPSKDRSNQQKHGVSLAEASDMDWDTALERLDARDDYGEDRYQALGFIGDRLYCAVYVDREDGRRMISLRKANNREYKEYERSY